MLSLSDIVVIDRAARLMVVAFVVVIMIVFAIAIEI